MYLLQEMEKTFQEQINYFHLNDNLVLELSRREVKLCFVTSHQLGPRQEPFLPNSHVQICLLSQKSRGALKKHRPSTISHNYIIMCKDLRVTFRRVLDWMIGFIVT
jgi:hypothetical protein